MNTYNSQSGIEAIFFFLLVDLVITGMEKELVLNSFFDYLITEDAFKWQVLNMFNMQNS